MDLHFEIDAVWGRRFEPARVIGDQFLRALDAMSADDPLLSGWGCFDEHSLPLGISIASLRDAFTTYIEEHPYVDYQGDPDGFAIDASTGYARGEEQAGEFASYFVHANSLNDRNRCTFSLGSYFNHAPRALITYPRFRSVLANIVEIWAPDVAEVTCAAWDKPYPAEASGDPTFPYSGHQMPWMAYFSSAPAKKVKPPSGVLVERTPEGGLFLIAARERLDPGDAMHMQASKALAEILIEQTGRGLR